MNTYQGRINHSNFGRANIMQTRSDANSLKFLSTALIPSTPSYRIKTGWANAHPAKSVPPFHMI